MVSRSKNYKGIGYLLIIFSGLLFMTAVVFSLQVRESIELSPQVSTHAVILNSCQEISQSGNYELGQNIFANSQECFNIKSDNVTLDGKGFSIFGSNTGQGVVINNNSISLTNLKIINFSYGVLVNFGQDVLITSNIFQGNGVGLLYSDSQNFVIVNRQNNFINNLYGILLTKSFSSTDSSYLTLNNVFTNNEYNLAFDLYRISPSVSIKLLSVSEKGAILSYNLFLGNNSYSDCRISLDNGVSQNIVLNEYLVSTNNRISVKNLKENLNYQVEVICRGSDTGEFKSNILNFKTLSSPNLSEDEYFTFIVNMSGDGEGKVISKPIGINCGSDCFGTFSKNSIINLTAYPFEGSIFTEFSGDCKGNQSCILIVNSSMKVDAKFIYLGDAPYPASSLQANLYASGRARLVWDDNSVNESGFNIYRSNSSNGEFVIVNSTFENINYYFDNLPNEKGKFYYKVRSYKDIYESIDSNVANIDLNYDIPLAPYDLNLKSLSTHDIQINWKVYDNYSTGFAILRSDSLRKGAFLQVGEVASNVSKFIDTNLSANKRYYYRLYSFNKYSRSSLSSIVHAKTDSCGIFAQLLSLNC